MRKANTARGAKQASLLPKNSDPGLGRIEELLDERDRLVAALSEVGALADRMSGAIERVKYLHYDSVSHGHLVCAHCGVRWPCDTVEILKNHLDTWEDLS